MSRYCASSPTSSGRGCRLRPGDEAAGSLSTSVATSPSRTPRATEERSSDRVRGAAPGRSPFGCRPWLGDVDALESDAVAAELEHRDPQHPRAAVVADRELTDPDVPDPLMRRIWKSTAPGYWERHSRKLATPSKRSPDCGNSRTASSWYSSCERIGSVSSWIWRSIAARRSSSVMSGSTMASVTDPVAPRLETL